MYCRETDKTNTLYFCPATRTLPLISRCPPFSTTGLPALFLLISIKELYSKSRTCIESSYLVSRHNQDTIIGDIRLVSCLIEGYCYIRRRSRLSLIFNVYIHIAATATAGFEVNVNLYQRLTICIRLEKYYYSQPSRNTR